MSAIPAYRLCVTGGPDAPLAIPLAFGQTITIGRSQRSTLILTDGSVSRTHCQLEVRKSGIVVSDLGSTAGTYLNATRIRRAMFQPADVLSIGASRLRLEVADPEAINMLQSPTRPRAATTTGEVPEEFIGKTLGKYCVERLLASGSRGPVFLARDVERDRDVALRLIFGRAGGAESIARFRRAVRGLRGVRNPHLVRILAAGQRGTYGWMAMDYIPGQNLAEVIRQIGTAGMLDWRMALRVVYDVADALDTLHARRIVHRHITPRSILWRASDKSAHLADIVLAKALEGEPADQITPAGQIVGEVPFLAPEQLTGSTRGDPRSDLYSLGVTAYALLTGRPPFEHSSLPELVRRIREKSPDRPKKHQLAIADLFEGAVLRLLAKHPQERHQTAAELRADLRRIAKYQGITL